MQKINNCLQKDTQNTNNMKSDLIRKSNISSSNRKHLLFVLPFLVLFAMLYSCGQKETAVKEKPISDLSIYNLPSKWTNQDGKNIEMKDLKGKVLVMVMIYTSCKAACPRLVADMRNIESRLSEDVKENVQLVLVSIDPEVDTPKRLKSFSIENKMDGNQWVFLRSTEENTREFAAVLAVNYKKVL